MYLLIGGLIGVVEGRAGIEQVGAAAVLPEAGRSEGEEGRGEHRRAVDHGGVDDLAFAGTRPLEQGGEDAGDQEHGAAAIVADEVQRRQRLSALRPDGVEQYR